MTATLATEHSSDAAPGTRPALSASALAEIARSWRPVTAFPAMTGTEPCLADDVNPEAWFQYLPRTAHTALVPRNPTPRMLARYAETLCAGCPIAAACLTWSVDNEEAVGVYGGMWETDRHQLMRRRSAAQRSA